MGHCLFQCKGDQIIARRRPWKPMAACGDNDILFAIASAKRYWRCASTGGQVTLPKLPAGFDIEGIDCGVECSGHEHQAAGGDNRPAERNRARSLRRVSERKL